VFESWAQSWFHTLLSFDKSIRTSGVGIAQDSYQGKDRAADRDAGGAVKGTKMGWRWESLLVFVKWQVKEPEA
jgi:hypothetical protein